MSAASAHSDNRETQGKVVPTGLAPHAKRQYCEARENEGLFLWTASEQHIDPQRLDELPRVKAELRETLHRGAGALKAPAINVSKPRIPEIA